MRVFAFVFGVQLCQPCRFVIIQALIAERLPRRGSITALNTLTFQRLNAKACTAYAAIQLIGHCVISAGLPALLANNRLTLTIL
jgi:hypothetical protein